jgi:N utilization substance protein A
MFIDALDVDDVLAHLIVAEGFSTVEEVAFVPMTDLLSIEGFDQDLADELRDRATTFLAEEEARLTGRRRELDVADALAAIPGLTAAMAVTLGEAGIKSLDDFADLSTDEVIDHEEGVLREYALTEEEANRLIMAARAHWFDDDDAEGGGADPGEDGIADTGTGTPAPDPVS